jgi:hypothetical protein
MNVLGIGRKGWKDDECEIRPFLVTQNFLKSAAQAHKLSFVEKPTIDGNIFS